jgi:hypothetical protein
VRAQCAGVLHFVTTETSGPNLLSSGRDAGGAGNPASREIDRTIADAWINGEGKQWLNRTQRPAGRTTGRPRAESAPAEEETSLGLAPCSFTRFSDCSGADFEMAST